MDTNQLEQRLEQLGSDLDRWPAAARRQAEILLQNNREAAKILASHRRLDQLLAQLPSPAHSELEQRVLWQSLPPQTRHPLDRTLDWLLPENHRLDWWRPALAACLPVFLGVLLGNVFSFGIGQETQVIDSWNDELAMLALSDYTENQLQP